MAGNFEFLEEDEGDYSEDEGCFVITSVPQSNEETEPEEEEEEEEQEVTNKVSMHIRDHFITQFQITYID